jgi:hypothetical protein
MGYKKRTDSTDDKRLAHEDRFSLTHLLHKKGQYYSPLKKEIDRTWDLDQRREFLAQVKNKKH